MSDKIDVKMHQALGMHLNKFCKLNVHSCIVKMGHNSPNQLVSQLLMAYDTIGVLEIW